MSITWHGDTKPAPPRKPEMRDWLRVIRRGAALIVILLAGLALLLVARGIEYLTVGLRRPVTPNITRKVCSAALWCLGMPVSVTGNPMRHHGTVVANHTSWMDIFTLNAFQNVHFVAKAEVAGWPGIGVLARSVGTVFINRDRAEAMKQQDLFEKRLHWGHKLLFFPEGTSTDGQRVLRFKPTLFEPFLRPALRDEVFIQPVTCVYFAPKDEPDDFYGWWGDMSFGAHLLKVLSVKRQGRIAVVFHDPIPAATHHDRKKLAFECEELIRATMHDLRGSENPGPPPFETRPEALVAAEAEMQSLDDTPS